MAYRIFLDVTVAQSEYRNAESTRAKRVTVTRSYRIDRNGTVFECPLKMIKGIENGLHYILISRRTHDLENICALVIGDRPSFEVPECRNGESGRYVWSRKR